MSSSPEVIHPQNVTEFAQCWKVMPLVRKDGGKGSLCTRLTSGDASSSGDDGNTKVRKPYTITKQRERWTESEHQKFLEALKLYGRAWRRIEEYIGTKTAVQIRSHAQKFFSKLEREASTGSPAGKIQEIDIPPPRPKRKPSHPYPKKAGSAPLTPEDDIKEAMAGQIAVSHEGIQSGSCSPYLGTGLGSGSVPLYRGPLVPGHFFRPPGSMKLFGKTVVVPKNHKPATQNDSSNKSCLNGESPSPGTHTHKPDFKRTAGFSPLVKLRNNVEGFTEEPLRPDNSGELLANDCGGGLPVMNEPGAAQLDLLNEGEEQQHGAKVELRAIAHKFGLPQHEVVNMDVQFSHLTHHSNPTHQWMDIFFRYHNGLSIPPMSGHGLPEAYPTNPLTYWQFLQALAANYAAYTAAMATAAATGWAGSIAGCEESPQAIGNDALPCAASPWWPFRGFMPSGYSRPMGSVNQGMRLDAASDSHPAKEYGNESASLHISAQGGQHPVELDIVDETEMRKPCSKFDLEDGEKRHRERSPSAKNGCVLGTSCITEAPSCERFLPDSAGQHEMDATVMRAKCCTQESDTERRVPFESPQSLYSSSEEFDGQVKKQGEGSSSGSNTPASRCQSGEWEAPTMLESKKRACYSLREDNTDTCSDAFIKPHQLCGVNSMESSNMRAKYAEKGRKHQQKDFLHGRDCDDSKRLKSCAHELEVRKEVSQEGRKAFQALFTSKMLPQKFPAANMVEGILCSFKQEYVSRPLVSKAESNSINVPNAQEPMQRASGDFTSSDGSQQGQESGNVHIIRSFSNNANMDFTISSGSGFVPYRRPLGTKPKMSESSAL